MRTHMYIYLGSRFKCAVLVKNFLLHFILGESIIGKGFHVIFKVITSHKDRKLGSIGSLCF